MSDLKEQLVKLGSDNPDLRKDLKPILDYISKEAYKNGDYGDQSRNQAFYPEQGHKEEPAVGTMKSASVDIFQEAANQFAAKHLTDLDYYVQQDLMEAVSRLHRGRDLKDPKDLLRSLMGERQDIDGPAGRLLDQMIHALEDVGHKSASQEKVARDFQSWLKEVDRHIQRKAMVSRMDLPDVAYKTWFNDGVSAKKAADRALKNAGF